MPDDLIKCPECGDWFNPAWLNEVAFHMHEGIIIDQTIKGERVMIEVKVKELRIGNLLDREGTGHPIEITAEHLYHWDKFKNVLFGIPITPEILEKCGGQKKNYGGYDFDVFINGDFPFPAVMQTEDKRWQLSINEEEYRTGVPFDFLHQLQNLYFALTGEELTVNL